MPQPRWKPPFPPNNSHPTRCICINKHAGNGHTTAEKPIFILHAGVWAAPTTLHGWFSQPCCAGACVGNNKVTFLQQGLQGTFSYGRRWSSKHLGADSPVWLPNLPQGARLPEMLSGTVGTAQKVDFSQPAQFWSSWPSQPLLCCPALPGEAIPSHLHHALLMACLGLCYSPGSQLEGQKLFCDRHLSSVMVSCIFSIKIFYKCLVAWSI